MGAWSTTAEARADLREFTHDGPQDRPFKDKQLLGTVGNDNLVFYTWEDRLVPGTFVPSVDYTDLASGQWVETDAMIGKITLTTAPLRGSVVRGRYFVRYFLDADLDQAMELACGQISSSKDVTTVVEGLRAAALSFGASFAFKQQAIRWTERMSDRMLLSDKPIDAALTGTANLFLQLSRDYMREGLAMRSAFYTSQDRRNTPAYAVIKPRINSIAPRR